MIKWEYAEVWFYQKIIIKEFSSRGHNQREYSLAEWPNVLALLGEEGWEMVSVIGSPNGKQYWYYFKRPVA